MISMVLFEHKDIFMGALGITAEVRSKLFRGRTSNRPLGAKSNRPLEGAVLIHHAASSLCPATAAKKSVHGKPSSRSPDAAFLNAA